MRAQVPSSKLLLVAALACGGLVSLPSNAQQVTYKPYVQPGDASAFGPKDQIVVAWQTSETAPQSGAYRVEFGSTSGYGSVAVTNGRVVNNYLAADPSLPVSPTAPGPHTDYHAVLSALEYDTTYFYRVAGPGMPADGFTASFRTRKRSSPFSFLVMGDEGFFPGVPGSANPRLMANYEARIVHLMYNAHNISLPGQPTRPKAGLALNTGDNVYNVGSEGSYRDFWMPVWNSDVDSNERGAPFIRSVPYYIVAGNHDIGGNGDRVNLLASDNAGRFSGNLDGGDALAYYNNYYFPLNGPLGVDPQYIFNGDASDASGFFLSYKGSTYSSPSAIEAFRASTLVDTGQGAKRQIDRMSNFSYDSGNAHFVFLDANPHLFNALVDYTATYQKPPSTFPAYPSVLREWLIKDLDASKQRWKIVVFHQPAFSSGNATLRNFQMRRIAQVLEDHGVNIVFNGHEHNYQRTLPLRVQARVADAPQASAPPAVAVDSAYDGATRTVPDGVVYVIEGAGGDRDFDGDLPPPRGSGEGVDQEDSATGSKTLAPGQVFAQGPASWLDTNLTNNEMAPLFAGAGTGPKITAKFKAKVFSFAQVVVDEDALTLYQISEPLLATSSATASNPAPYGTDANSRPMNDPIPATLLDATTGQLVSPPAEGTPALMDKFVISKPDVSGSVAVQLSAPPAATLGGALVYSVVVTNNAAFALNGAQALITLPEGADFADAPSDTTTVQGRDAVLTLGRLASGERRVVQLRTRVAQGVAAGVVLTGRATFRSSTAQAVDANPTTTQVVAARALPLR